MLHDPQRFFDNTALLSLPSCHWSGKIYRNSQFNAEILWQTIFYMLIGIQLENNIRALFVHTMLHKKIIGYHLFTAPPEQFTVFISHIVSVDLAHPVTKWGCVPCPYFETHSTLVSRSCLVRRFIWSMNPPRIFY